MIDWCWDFLSSRKAELRRASSVTDGLVSEVIYLIAEHCAHNWLLEIAHDTHRCGT